MNIPNPYTLPSMDFVGGSTQDLVFHCYHYLNKKAKQMDMGAAPDVDGEVSNVLRVALAPLDTVNLPAGKYIYQITIKDISGDVEIPNQGIIHIINNINKAFVR